MDGFVCDGLVTVVAMNEPPTFYIKQLLWCSAGPALKGWIICSSTTPGEFHIPHHWGFMYGTAGLSVKQKKMLKAKC